MPALDLPAGLSANFLLNELQRSDAARLDWETFESDRGDIPAHEAQHYVFFPTSGLFALHRGNGAQLALIGLRGSTGVSFGRHLVATVLCAGSGWRVSRAALRELTHRSAHVDELLASDDDALLGQAFEQVERASLNTVQQRVAAWIERAVFQTGRDRMRITHEQIARLLAVRRAGVTLAVQHLEEENAIRTQRGSLTVRDVATLARCRHMPEHELDIGAQPSPTDLH